MMRLDKRFGQRVIEARGHLGLSQGRLAELAGLSRRRLSYLETGRQQPRAEEIEQIAAVLGVPRGELRNLSCCDSREDRRASRAVYRRHREKRRYQPQRDPEAWRRFQAACEKYKATLDQLRSRLDARPDIAIIKVWLGLLFLDSALELVAVLWLLSAGARPIFAAPHLLGFDRQAVIHPKKHFVIGHRRMHALALLLDGLELVVFPQVSLASKGSAPRLDFLVAVARTRGPMVWFGVEVDGPGHDPEGNQWKDSAVKVPIVRLGKAEVLSGGFVNLLLDAARRRLRGARALAA